MAKTQKNPLAPTKCGDKGHPMCLERQIRCMDGSGAKLTHYQLCASCNRRLKMLNNLVAPLSRRLGSALAGWVGGIMVIEPAMAQSIEAWAIMGCGIVVDLGLSYADRRFR